MSHIAAALAKSKGKEVQPPPLENFPSDSGFPLGQPPAPQAMPGEVKGISRSLKLGLIAGAALFVLGIGLFVMLRSPKPAPASVAKPAATAKATPPAPATQVPAATSPAKTPAPTVVAAPVAAPPPAPEPIVVKPTEELLAAVHQFSVSAVMSGPNGRARIDGKNYQIGDTVLPGLVFVEIKDGQLYFRDSVGAIYTHRF